MYRRQADHSGWRPPPPKWAHYCPHCNSTVANDDSRHYGLCRPGAPQPPHLQRPGPALRVLQVLMLALVAGLIVAGIARWLAIGCPLP